MIPSAAPERPSSFGYRPDVDGLRALAVVPVLLYHARLACSGGFVGVDVFFVISGFVISSLILKEAAAGSFSMVNFWERRVRRIMPALSLVVAATLAAGWLFFLPEDFLRLGSSTMAQALMGANFYFWKDGNYFDPGADTKPLLHTWSLAVEEQFYLLFPLLLTFLIRSKNRTWQRWIWGIALGSLILCIALTYSRTNQRAAFYLLPMRAWELLLGALLAMSHGRFAPGKAAGEISGWLGLALICGPLIIYDESTRFPGLAALPPCLGAALIIASSTAQCSSVGRLLSFKPFVFIGLISYPLYLWHWPLLVFAKYLSAFEPGAWTRGGLLVMSLLLSVFSWRVLEMPIRQRRWLGTRGQIFTFGGGATAIFLLFALGISCSEGIPARFPARALAYAGSRDHHAFREKISTERALAGDFTPLGSAKQDQPISVLLWGDSHAMAVAPAVDQLCREHSQRAILAAFHSTPPLLKYTCPSPHSLGDKSAIVAASVLSFIAKQQIKNVVITANWDEYEISAEFKAALVDTVRAIMAAGAHAYVLKDVPKPGFDVPRIVALTAMRGGDLENLGVTTKQQQQYTAALEATFEQLAQMGATVLDPTPLFLNSRGIYGVLKKDQVLYYDGHHLTTEGAALLMPLLKPVLDGR